MRLSGVPLIESPLFGSHLYDGTINPEDERVARDLNEQGFAVIDFPDPDIGERIDRIKHWLAERFQLDLADPRVVASAGDLRLQDGWRDNPDIAAIATNAAVSGLLGRLYGRKAFPFQTLNFPVGTQQHAHSDAVHFSSLPERFMCGVWVALQDVDAAAGPLEYYPGSHRWPITSNSLIGRRGWGSQADSAQHPYEAVWRALIAETGIRPQTFLAKRGQALIWCANLLHGGQARVDRTLTRWSQVTHYYFDDCIYYTPAFSDEALGQLALRELPDIDTGQVRRSSYLGTAVAAPSAPGSAKTRRSFRERLRRALAGWREA